MRDTKLYDLISGISKEEFEILGDFLRSPYHNKKRSVINFYEFIKLNFDKLREGSLTKEDIISGFLKKTGSDESLYWKITSNFSSMIDKFLIYQQFSVEKHFRNNMLLEAYRKRDIKRQFRVLGKIYSDQMEKEQSKGINYFYNKTHFYFQKISYEGIINNKEIDKSAQRLFESSKMGYFMMSLVSLSILLNIHPKAADEVWLIDEMLDNININSKKVKESYPAVYVFYLIVMLRLKNRDSIYPELKEIVFSQAENFSINILRHILLNMLNFSIMKLREGNDYLKEVYEIKKLMEIRSLTLDGECLHPDRFYSAIEGAAEFNDLEWAENFRDKYIKYVSPKYRNSAIHLADSKINFIKGKYPASLKDLLFVKNIDPYYYLSQKVLLIQNYYKLNNMTAILPVLDTLRKYFNKNNTDDSIKEYQKFIKYFNMLDLPREKFKKEISGEKYFINRNWLINESTRS